MSTPIANAANTGPVVIAINSVLAVIATLLVGLRFWSRRLTGADWRIDDYLALAALFFQNIIYALSNEAVVHGGLGREMTVVLAEDPAEVQYMLKILFVCCFLYGVVSPLIKLSVLFFYRRVFPTRGVHIGTLVIGLLCVGWFIAIITVNSIQCHPTSSFWDPVGDYKCINLILYFVGNSAANVVIDALTLTLPIREVLRLHVSWHKKVGLCGVFLLGGFVVIASLIRTISLGVLYRTGVTNVTKQYVTMWVATTVEIYIAIIGSCLPTIVPAYRKLRYGNVLEVSSAASRSHGAPTKGCMENGVGSNLVKALPRSHIREADDGALELLPHGAQRHYRFCRDPFKV